jgi:hypothetical protein
MRDLHDRWCLLVTPDEPGTQVTIEEVSNHYGD